MAFKKLSEKNWNTEKFLTVSIKRVISQCSSVSVNQLVIKSVNRKPATTLILGERLNAFLLRAGARQRSHSQHFYSTQCWKTQPQQLGNKKKRRHSCWEGRSKIVTLQMTRYHTQENLKTPPKTIRTDKWIQAKSAGVSPPCWSRLYCLGTLGFNGVTHFRSS